VPLVTDNIEEARTAYSVLEVRAQRAESLAQTLQSALDNTRIRPGFIQDVHDIRQVLLDREAVNENLRVQLQQAIVTKADLPLENFIASIGLAVAVGQASMPDRTVPSLSASLQSYVTPTESSVGLRFFQPGVDGHPESLSTTTFQIALVPPAPGLRAPRNLYTVLLEKQSLYTNTFWARFVTSASPPAVPANDIVVALTAILANSGSWNYSYLLQSSMAVGNSEKALAALVSVALPGDAATAFSAAVSSLLALTTALAAKPTAVAGDLFALTASLDNVTSVARALLP
jgi:hypothetical protein